MEDIEALKRELATAYNLLAEALPLAFRAIRAGVPPIDQKDFWHYFEKVEHFIDIEIEESDRISPEIHERIIDLERTSAQ